MRTHITLLWTLLFILFSCKKVKETPISTNESIPFKIKNHTYAQLDSAKITHMKLNLGVDFNQNILKGYVTFAIEAQSKRIFLDTYNLKIDTILADGKPTSFSFSKKDANLGQGLAISITPETKEITIFYKTSPSAEALQWLKSEQTSDKKHPFLYTQGQSIYTRSWIPIQDTPEIRLTYDAEIKVPKGMMAVMSAENPKKKKNSGVYSFKMQQPIPPYLIALAVGDLDYKAFDSNSGIYAEPTTLPIAYSEFLETPKMIQVAEKLYGKYAWEQYDLIVMPPSFPFGGMENPRLTFVTPTVIVGDQSLTSIIAHELAHSWSGNLVTNATWNDFWLNEGFTVYLERRIMEDLYGKATKEMLEYKGKLDYDRSVNYLIKNNRKHDIQLKLNLKGRHPDEGVTDIPYEKGYFFLKMLEQTYGREKFDQFIKSYFSKYQFKTIDTDTFITYLKENLIETDSVLLNEWIFTNKTPPNFPEVKKDVFADIPNVKELDSSQTINWNSQQWIYFINSLKEENIDTLLLVDELFHLSESKNAEIFTAWAEITIPKKYDKVIPYVEHFLQRIGRTKFLEVLYPLLMENGYEKEAKETYEKARPMYHAASIGVIDKIVK
ncbi:MAG: M1 family metallopeptidase [Flavobacteriales bacterium]